MKKRKAPHEEVTLPWGTRAYVPRARPIEDATPKVKGSDASEDVTDKDLSKHAAIALERKKRSK